MSEPVTYVLEDSIATITMDDGKVNALSLRMLAALSAALDRAERDRAIIVLGGVDPACSRRASSCRFSWREAPTLAKC
jgi:enoyl-CoA hydratase/carnithine racemase